MKLYAHDKSKLLDKLSGKKPIKCSNKCSYFKFPNLDRACILSDAYSVCQGDLCYIYELVALEKEITP